ncbi:MAG: regulatory iron-sulfur-containing complex subunit RicT [bacterium]
MKVRAGTVRFEYLNKSFIYDASDIEAKSGDTVIVDTDYGLDHGILEDEISELEIYETEAPLQKIQRVAAEEDLEQIRNLQPKEEKARQICEEEISRLGLKMKLASVRSSYDGSKVSFCYTSDGRVDFRELVRVLASRLKARIELRQVGVRDEARLIGGLGICGRALCCTTFLKEFQSVSIKMAKEQGLQLNPTKISGVCGRLFCCLKYEYDHYCEMREKMPQIGETIAVNDDQGRVTAVNVPKESVILEFGEGVRKEFPVRDLDWKCGNCGKKSR